MRNKTIVRTAFALFSTLAAAAMLTFLCSLHTAGLPQPQPVALADLNEQVACVDWTTDGRELAILDDALAGTRLGADPLRVDGSLALPELMETDLSPADLQAGQPVPEPATAVLLGVGGVAVLLRRKRRKAAKSLPERPAHRQVTENRP